MYDTDVFVVGGGPAGLAAALAVRAKGLDVIVADPARPPIDKACGEGLMPDGLAALAALGVTLTPAEGFPFRGIRFLNSDVSVAADFPTGPGVGIRRTALHGALTDAAFSSGAHLMWGKRVSHISTDGVTVDGDVIRARWIIGADGENSRVRAWTGLDTPKRCQRRFGFRRHYRVEPWTDSMEIYWGPSAQIYVTPVTPTDVCVALISRDPHLRLDAALPRIPAIAERLKNAPVSTDERGAVTATRKLRSVYTGSVALIGDASGSVDAITGEGLCLAFHQALALADAMDRGDLAAYAVEHARIARKPGFMAALMLAFDERPVLRDRVFRALSARPAIFEDMLGMHVGDLSARVLVSNGFALAREMTL